MSGLKSEFTKHAAFSAAINGAAHQTDTQSDADSMDVLTFEYEDNPFTSFIKKLETLMETDPQEALRLIRLAIADEVFERKSQLKKLSETLDEATELCQQEREPEHGIAGVRHDGARPQKDFFKAVFDLPSSRPELRPEERPAFTPATPTYRPFAA